MGVREIYRASQSSPHVRSIRYHMHYIAWKTAALGTSYDLVSMAIQAASGFPGYKSSVFKDELAFWRNGNTKRQVVVSKHNACMT